MPKAKAVELTQDQSSKLGNWFAVTQQLADIKAKEFELREWIIANIGFDPTKQDGSQTLDVGSGWKLKALKVLNYKATNDNGEIVAALNLLGSATGGGRPDLAQRLVSWPPQLSVTAYKETLPIIESMPALKELFAKAISFKPGAPQLELIPPKAEADETKT